MIHEQIDLLNANLKPIEPQNIIEEALHILSRQFKRESVSFTTPQAVKNYCRLKLAQKEHEVFGVMFLDNQNRLIAFKEMFRGTIDGCSVYIREVAKDALRLNAAAMIFTHNHPSGVCEPSQADLTITRKLIDALALFDIRVLDHIVVSLEDAVSMAERGLLGA